MTGEVVIDCLPESADRYRDNYAIIAIDVIRATTTATTALNLGRRVFPARTTDDAQAIASSLVQPLLVGELGGNMPVGFDETNSPAAIAKRVDIHRPMVLVSSSGTDLIMRSAGAEAIYLACLRNFSAVAAHVAGRHSRVAVLGAGTRGCFRNEDQMGCARVAELLIASGYTPKGDKTTECVDRWRGVDVNEIRNGMSAAYLRRSSQEPDLEFVLSHIDDVTTVPFMVRGELVPAMVASRANPIAGPMTGAKLQ